MLETLTKTQHWAGRVVIAGKTHIALYALQGPAGESCPDQRGLGPQANFQSSYQISCGKTGWQRRRQLMASRKSLVGDCEKGHPWAKEAGGIASTWKLLC